MIETKLFEFFIALLLVSVVYSFIYREDKRMILIEIIKMVVQYSSNYIASKLSQYLRRKKTIVDRLNEIFLALKSENAAMEELFKLMTKDAKIENAMLITQISQENKIKIGYLKKYEELFGKNEEIREPDENINLKTNIYNKNN